MTTTNYRNGWHLAQLNLALILLENRFKLDEVIKIGTGRPASDK